MEVTYAHGGGGVTHRAPPKCQVPGQILQEFWQLLCSRGSPAKQTARPLDKPGNGGSEVVCLLEESQLDGGEAWVEKQT